MVRQHFCVGPASAEHGGAPVKAERSLRSEPLGRLAVGAVLAVEEVQGARVHFEKLSGVGPLVGWVSTSFLLPISEKEAEERKGLEEQGKILLGRSLLAQAEAKVQSLGASKALAEARATATETFSMLVSSASLLSLGRPQDAWEAVEQAMQKCQHDEDADAKASSSLLSAIVLLTLKKGQEALQRASEALTGYRSLADRQMEASSLCVIANIRLLNRSFGAAMEAAESALTIFREISDFEGEAMADLIILEASASKGQPSSSSSSSAQPALEREDAMTELSSIQALMSSGNFDLAQSAAEELLSRCAGGFGQSENRLQHLRFLEASALQLVAAATAASIVASGLAAAPNAGPRVPTLPGDVDLDAMSQAGAHGVSDLEGREEGSANSAEEVRQALDLALQRAEWSRYLFAQSGDQRSEGLAAHTAAQLYSMLGEHAFALRVAMEAIVLCRGCEDEQGELSAMHMAVHMAARLGRLAEALRLGKELEVLARKIGESSTVAAVESLLSHIQDALPRQTSVRRSVGSRPKSQLEDIVGEWGRAKLATSTSSTTPSSFEELPACVVWKVPVKSMTYLAYCLEIIKFTEDLKNEASNVNLLVVTQGVFARQMGEEMPANWTSIGASAIWAVVRNIRMESPKLMVSVVDLPPGASPLEISDCIQLAQRWTGPRNEIGFFLDRRHRLQAEAKPKS